MAQDQVLRSSVLIVRHLPSSLSAYDKEDFLRHFGAISVRCMADKGRMKHAAFATFQDHSNAAQALHRLHQLDVLGHTLSVEFAKTQRQLAVAVPSVDDRYHQDTSNGENKAKKVVPASWKANATEIHRKGMAKATGLGPKLGVLHPLNPRLKYRYPPPTVSLLSNIVNALASVPKFYNQVLHLMNKMNLPAPFGPLTPAPPLEEDQIVVPPEPAEATPADMELSSSSEESELESDEETRERAKKEAKQLSHALKRPAKRKAPGQRKRPRVQDMIAAMAKPASSGGTLPVQRADVFDAAQSGLSRKPEIRLAESITSALERQIQQVQNEPADLLSSEMPETVTTPVKEDASGFGTFQPTKIPDAVDDSTDKKGVECKEEEEDEEEEPESSEFITREQLKKRLSKEEMKHISVFKNYNAGDPTTRLYLKNLSKQVEEKDLKFIYGRYVDWSSPIDKDMFSIQLMKQGRMKGQAFVGLPSEFVAQKALKDTNGFILHDKPIVVSFARSAKPKEKAEPKTKKPREGRRI